MKKAALLMAVLGCAAGLTAAETTVSAVNTFGVLRVDSSAGQTIVAVPWVKAQAGSDGAINVADIVKTANLKNGDKLLYYTGSAYKAWQIETDPDSGVKSWSPVNIVDDNGLSATAAANDETLARGGAMLLLRSNPESCFYLFGQVAASGASAPAITAGTASAAVYNLIAPPSVKTGSLDLNADITWSGCNADDEIDIGTAGGVIRCYWNSAATAWQKKDWSTVKQTIGGKEYDVKTFGFVAGDITIPVGTGFWYVSRNATAPTITWKDVPTR